MGGRINDGFRGFCSIREISHVEGARTLEALVVLKNLLLFPHLRAALSVGCCPLLFSKQVLRIGEARSWCDGCVSWWLSFSGFFILFLGGL